VTEKVIVREEQPADFAAIAAVVEAAFGKADEAHMIEDIRASDGYVPELSFVAEEDGEMLGHTMLSYVGLEGTSRRLLELGPMAVHPAHQRQGIGSALARASLAAADELGEPLVLVIGHSTYYPRFGFRPASELGIAPPSEEIPKEAWMAVPLRAYDGGIRGRVVFPRSFR
jgi:putative acetyltransferase